VEEGGWKARGEVKIAMDVGNSSLLAEEEKIKEIPQNPNLISRKEWLRKSRVC